MRSSSLATSRTKIQSVGNSQTPLCLLGPPFCPSPSPPLSLLFPHLYALFSLTHLPWGCPSGHPQHPTFPTKVQLLSGDLRGGSQNEPLWPKEPWGETEGTWVPGRPSPPQRLTPSYSRRLQGLRGCCGGVSPLHPLLRHLRQQGPPPPPIWGTPSLPTAALQTSLPEPMVPPYTGHSSPHPHLRPLSRVGPKDLRSSKPPL